MHAGLRRLLCVKLEVPHLRVKGSSNLCSCSVVAGVTVPCICLSSQPGRAPSINTACLAVCGVLTYGMPLNVCMCVCRSHCWTLLLTTPAATTPWWR